MDSVLTNKLSSETVTVVVNPAARDGHLGRRFNRLRPLLDASGLNVDVVVTAGPGNGVELARTACDQGRFVVAAGGDGTVNEVARGVLQSGTPTGMAVLPLGSGNDFARMLGMAENAPAAVRQLERCELRRVDVGRVRYRDESGEHESVFVNNVGVGFDGHVASVAPRFKGYPMGMGYLMSILYGLATFKSTHAVVTDASDPSLESFDAPFFFMTVGNARDSAGGYTINPRASIVDGWLDVCLVAAVSPLRALRMLPAARNGGHLRYPEVRYWHTRELYWRADIPAPMHTDGEVRTVSASSVRIEVEPAALPVFVPYGHAGRL